MTTEIITPGAVLPTNSRHPDERTDLALAEVFIAVAGNECRWVPGIGYHFWDGKRWQRDDGDVFVREAGKRAVLTLKDETRRLRWEGLSEDERKAWTRFLVSCQMDGTLGRMLHVAQTHDRIVAYVRELDARPNELNTQSGILDLGTLQLREHDPDSLHTKVTNAGYDATAKAPFWLDTVTKALPNADVRRYVQKLLGQALLGKYSEHLLVAHGKTGSNFKSTIFGAVRDVLGDYAIQASSDLLVDHTTGSPRSDAALASTRGARFLVASETAEGVPLADALIKMLTGEHEITAKYMRQDYITFPNQCGVALITNHRPRVQSSDEAIWRRLVLVPFDYVVEAKDRLDPAEVQATLRKEQDGILLWLVEGLRMWREEGLRDVPPAIRTATDDYRKESDPMAEWLEEAVTFEEGAHERVTLVRAAYDSHCETNGRQPLGAQRFNATLERRGAKRQKVRVAGEDGKSWVGLRLKTS